MSPHVITWTVAALATAGVIVRPFNLPEAIWAVAGAVVLVVLGLISMPDALTGVAKGTDVYLFLFGMMLLAEIAREEGLFEWLAAVATSHAKGSARRLFLLLRGRHDCHDFPVERRDGGRADAGRRRGGSYREGRTAAALPSDLRFHRQCGIVRAADLESGQSRHLRQPHAAAAATGCRLICCHPSCRSPRPIWCCAGPSEARSAKRSRAMFRSPYFPAPARPRRSESGRPPSLCWSRRRSTFSSVCPPRSQAPRRRWSS